MIQLICISIAIYARPGKDASLNNGIREGTSVDSQDITRFVSFQFSRINKINQHLFYKNFFYFRYCFEIATLFGAIEFLFIQQGEEIKNSGMKSFLKNLVNLRVF